MTAGTQCKFYRVILFLQLDNYINALIKLFQRYLYFSGNPPHIVPTFYIGSNLGYLKRQIVVYLSLSRPHIRVNLTSGETFNPEMVKESAHAAPTHSFAMLIPSITKPRISILSKLASWNTVRSLPSANSIKCPALNWSSIFSRVSVSQRVRGSLESRIRKGWLLPLPSNRLALISSGKNT